VFAGGAGLAVGVAGGVLGRTFLSTLNVELPWSPKAKVATVGVLSPSPDDPSSLLWQKLGQRGWTRGDNLIVEHRTGTLMTYRSRPNWSVSALR
jgi:hypothetical protein